MPPGTGGHSDERAERDRARAWVELSWCTAKESNLNLEPDNTLNLTGRHERSRSMVGHSSPHHATATREPHGRILWERLMSS